jgi:hypothetical protein
VLCSLPLSEAVSIPSPNQNVGLQLTLYRKLLTQKVRTLSGEVEVESLVLAWRARQVLPSSNLRALPLLSPLRLLFLLHRHTLTRPTRHAHVRRGDGAPAVAR